jgi:hypothetical protein
MLLILNLHAILEEGSIRGRYGLHLCVAGRSDLGRACAGAFTRVLRLLPRDAAELRRLDGFRGGEGPS